VNGNTTTYALDINTSLPEVLSDGQFTYLYGLGNVAQVNASGAQYFLGDALNSTRQLTDASGQISLAQSYDPFGSVSFSAGDGQSVYGYTSEQSDPSGLVYLRSRYYSPNEARFISKDTWAGDVNQPLSLNQWNYVEGNPINYVDPSGYSPVCDNGDWDRCGIPDWWKRRSHLYVDGYGYFEVGHLKRGWESAEYIHNQFTVILEMGGELHLSSKEIRGDPPRYEEVYWANYSISTNVKNMTSKQKIGVMYGIYIDFERGYEYYQFFRGDRFPSAFSPEDLPSDHLGFWAYVNGYEKDEIPDLLGCLGEVRDLGDKFLGSLVIDIHVNHHGDASIIGIPRNFKFSPMMTETIDSGTAIQTRTKNVPWPSWLEIKPVPSGPNTWRKVSVGHEGNPYSR